MFKVRCKNNFVADVYNLDIGGTYNCKIKDNLYVVYDMMVVGNNSSILSLTYNEKQFRDRFIDICEERKLKLEKINESTTYKLQKSDRFLFHFIF